MNKVSKSLIVLFLAFLMGSSFGVYSIQAQDDKLVLEVIEDKECDIQYSGDNCVAEITVTNTTGKTLDGEAFFDIDYSGVCGNSFEVGGIDAWYDNQASKMEWNNESKRFVSAGFEIPDGISQSNLEIHTSSALCPGEYTFTLMLEGTTEEGEKIVTPLLPMGGGGVFIAKLTISNESIVSIKTDTVTITWQTNKFATSRVIYDIISHPTLGNSPNYGYVFSTPEQDQDPKVSFHSVRIDGLTPGTTYFYRTVSRASPEKVSREHTFTTKGVAGAETEKEAGEEEEGEEGPAEGPGEWTGPGTGTPPTGGVEPTVEGTTTKEKEEPIAVITPAVMTSFFPSLLADIGDIFGGLGNTCYPCFPWWVILILGISLLIEGALSKRRERRRAKKWFNLSLIFIVLSIIFYLTNYHCVAIWVYLALVLSTLLFWRFVDPKGKKYPFIVGLSIILILFIIYLILKCLYIWIILIAILVYLFIADFLKKKKKREQMSVGV
jgi:hypothetical protein